MLIAGEIGRLKLTVEYIAGRKVGKFIGGDPLSLKGMGHGAERLLTLHFGIRLKIYFYCSTDSG